MGKLRYFIIYLVVAITAVTIFIFWESDEDRILKNLDRLGAVLSKSSTENNTALLVKLATLQKLCAKDCSVQVEEITNRTLKGREDILVYFRVVWTRASPQKAWFEDIIININDDATSAECNLTAYLIVQNDRTTGRQRTENFKVKMVWVKADSDWQLASVIAKLEASAATVAPGSTVTE